MLALSKAAERAPPDDRHFIAGEVVGAQEFAHFQLDQFEELGIVHHIALVQEDDNARHFDLAGEENVLAGLGIGPSGALTTRIAPSIWAAPVIMFLM